MCGPTQSFPKWLAPLQWQHVMVYHRQPVGSFFVPSCIICTTPTTRPSSIILSFIIAWAQANSWLVTSMSIWVKAWRSHLTYSGNPLMNARGSLWSLIPPNNTMSFFNSAKYTLTNSPCWSHHLVNCSYTTNPLQKPYSTWILFS